MTHSYGFIILDFTGPAVLANEHCGEGTVVQTRSPYTTAGYTLSVYQFICTKVHPDVFTFLSTIIVYKNYKSTQRNKNVLPKFCIILAIIYTICLCILFWV